MARTTLELLTDIRLRTKIPASSLNFTNEETLRLATDEMWSEIVPMLLASQQEFFVTRTDVALTDGAAVHRIPPRAIGAKLRDVVLVDRSTGRTSDLGRVDPESSVGAEDRRGMPTAFVVEGNAIRLLPTPQGGQYSLRLTYYARPARLCLPFDAAMVSAVNRVTGRLTLTMDQLAVLGSDGSATVDVVRARPLYDSILVDAVGALFDFGSQIQLTPSQVAEVSVGDWVCLAGTAPVIQVPEELHPLLVQKVAAIQLAATGDESGAAAALGTGQSKEVRAGALTQPRVDGATIKQQNGLRKWRGYR